MTLLTILVVMIILTVFVIMAIRHWDQKIGAGPTILIIGFLFLTGFVSTSYIKYNNELAIYNRCVDRQVYLAEQYIFNENLIIALGHTANMDEAKVKELRNLLIEPEGLHNCIEATYF